MNNYIFTDIDGVLNTINRNQWNKTSIDLYNKLCHEFKDTLAELFNKHFGLTFMSSSQASADFFLYDQLKDKYGYTSLFLYCIY